MRLGDLEGAHKVRPVTRIERRQGPRNQDILAAVVAGLLRKRPGQMVQFREPLGNSGDLQPGPGRDIGVGGNHACAGADVILVDFAHYVRRLD